MNKCCDEQLMKIKRMIIYSLIRCHNEKQFAREKELKNILSDIVENLECEWTESE